MASSAMVHGKAVDAWSHAVDQENQGEDSGV